LINQHTSRIKKLHLVGEGWFELYINYYPLLLNQKEILSF
jgi:hypothetical protein